MLSRFVRFASVALVVAFTATLAERSNTAAQSSQADPCNLQTSERIVAIGDVHGAYDQFLTILQATKLTDARGRWTGGRAILVQTGDVVDRGGDSRKVLDLLRRLERDAERAGGAVHALLGNHEVMVMVGDWRYVSPDEIAAFRNGGSSELRDRLYAVAEADAEARAQKEQQPHDERAYRERFMKEIPLGFIEMRQAFSPEGEYGRWLRQRPVAVRINGVLFLHGGVSAEDAPLGCAGLNAAVRTDLSVPNPTPEQIAAMKASSETGPLWYRGLAEEPEETFAPTVTTVLEAVGARAIVIGHTVTDDHRIHTRFAGRVVQIDTGMLGGKFFPGGGPSALELGGGGATAVYPDRREPLTMAK